MRLLLGMLLAVSACARSAATQTVGDATPAGGAPEHGIHFWTGSRGTLVERNLLKNNARAIGFGLVARDGAVAAIAGGNYEHAPLDFFVDVAGGDLHLRATATEVFRGGAALSSGVCDDDIDSRPRRLDAPSIGAHER